MHLCSPAPLSNHRPFETTIISTKDNNSPLFTTEEFVICYLILCVFKVLLFIVSLQKGELKLDQLIQHRTSVSAQRLAAHTASVWQLAWYKRAYSLIIVIYSAAWSKFNQYWGPNFLSRFFFHCSDKNVVGPLLRIRNTGFTSMLCTIPTNAQIFVEK